MITILHRNFILFLKEKGIEESHWADIVLYIINKVRDEREKGLLIFTIGRSVNQLVTNVDRFMLMLEAIEDQYHDFNRIHDLLTDLDIDLVRMKDLYQKFEHSDKALVKKAGGTMLGLIGRKLPEFLFQELDKNFDSSMDDYDEIEDIYNELG
jgi:transposase